MVLEEVVVAEAEVVGMVVEAVVGTVVLGVEEVEVMIVIMTMTVMVTAKVDLEDDREVRERAMKCITVMAVVVVGQWQLLHTLVLPS